MQWKPLNWHTEQRKKAALISSGFAKWKNALEQIDKHQNVVCHKTSATCEVVVPQCVNVDEMIDQIIKIEYELNHKCLIVVIENLNDLDSNFYQLLILKISQN